MDVVSEFVVSCDCRRKVQSKFEKKNSFAYIHVIYSMQSYCLYIYNMAYIHMIHIYIYIYILKPYLETFKQWLLRRALILIVMH
jgi:hypothetical protein